MENEIFDRFERFTVLINRVLRSIHKIKSNEMSKFGLKSTHLTCLYYLYRENGSLTAKELCDICGEDKAAVSRAIENLEEMGYVYCESKTEKRYKSPLSLTDGGLALSKEIATKVDEFLNKASEGLDENKRKIFYESLTLISDNLQKICKENI